MQKINFDFRDPNYKTGSQGRYEVTWNGQTHTTQVYDLLENRELIHTIYDISPEDSNKSVAITLILIHKIQVDVMTEMLSIRFGAVLLALVPVGAVSFHFRSITYPIIYLVLSFIFIMSTSLDEKEVNKKIREINRDTIINSRIIF